jgi:hypothetical protein
MSESIQIYLNSAVADKYYNDSISDCEFVLPVIEIPNGFHIYLSLHSALIPYSFYNINATNNVLNYNINSIDYSLTIDEGNYNVNQLITFLSTNMNGMSIVYNSITNKFTFSYTSAFSLLSSSTCFSIIGFNSSTSYTSTANILKSVNCINMHQIKCINIVTNLSTYNINKSFLNNFSILSCIPVNSPPYSIIEYNNSNNYRCNLFMNELQTIKIKLVDEYENLINLNGCHFSLTLQLDVVSFMED